MNISLSTLPDRDGYSVPVVALERVTPEVFNHLRQTAYCFIVCVGGDILNSYVVSFNDKGCDEAGVYYKACVYKTTNTKPYGHFDSVWFHDFNFRERVGEFIRNGGDMVLPVNDDLGAWLAY